MLLSLSRLLSLFSKFSGHNIVIYFMEIGFLAL